jgi:predicted metal-dependent hydrolase
MKRYRISANNHHIDYEIGHRPTVTRRIHLEINDEGDLRVIAPRRMNRRDIHKTLQQRANHVVRFLVRARSRQRDLPQYRYISGEEHLFMGQGHALRIRERPGRRASVALTGRLIDIAVPEPGRDRIRNQLLAWYRRQAQTQFAGRLAQYAQAALWNGGQVPVMRLRRMKRTWGSCSSKGVITFNPQLIKAPLECIDYVVAHEVCHLREHNHGKAFYALQEQLYPHWREAKARLKAEGHIYLHL